MKLLMAGRMGCIADLVVSRVACPAPVTSGAGGLRERRPGANGS